MRQRIFAFGAVIGLAACSTGGSDSPSSLLNDDGSFKLPLLEAEGAVITQAGASNGYAFEVGFTENRDGFQTQAALFDDIDLPAPTASNTISMTGAYQLETLQNPVTINGELEGTRLSRARNITLTVDFDNNAISGSDAGLALDGTFTDAGQLTGSASLDGMTGDWSGLVSNDVSIAVFEGDSATGVFAGGLLVER